MNLFDFVIDEDGDIGLSPDYIAFAEAAANSECPPWPHDRIRLRHYQSACEEAIFDGFAKHKSGMAVMATGTGKTVVIAKVNWRWLREKRGRILCLAHRDELVTQMYDKVRAVLPGKVVHREDSDNRAYTPSMISPGGGQELPYADVVVASKDCLCDENRLKRFPRDWFSLIVTDECHHAVKRNTTYTVIYLWFPDACHLGVTATPKRGDDLTLRQTYEQLLFHYPLPTAVKDGWLVEPVTKMIRVKSFDLSLVKMIRKKNGDPELCARELRELIEQEKNVHGLVGPVYDLACAAGDRRKVVLFANSVKESQVRCDILNRIRPGSAAHIDGKTVKKDRRDIVERFKGGDVQFLCNKGVFVEGYDDSGIRMVVPSLTAVAGKYEQEVGRGARPLDSILSDLNAATDATGRRSVIAGSAKPTFLVVDQAGSNGRHRNQIGTADLFAGVYDPTVVSILKSWQNRRGEAKVIRVDQALREAKLYAEEQERKKLSHVVIRVDYEVVDQGDGFVAGDQPAGVGDATEKQCRFLMKIGYSRREVYAMSRKRAGQLIGDHKYRCDRGLLSAAQERILLRYEYRVHNMSRKEATKILRELELNDWQRPKPVMPELFNDADGERDEGY